MNNLIIKKYLIIVLALATLVSFIIFSQLDPLEMIMQISSNQERYEINGLISSFIVFSICTVLFSIRRLQEERKLNLLLIAKNNELQKAFKKIKVLEGVLPICSYCKNIKDEQGDWSQIEQYIDHHSEAEFSHGICPACIEIPKGELEKLSSKSKKSDFPTK
ncbi:MAG: hypothetical protein Q9M17_08125 [Mariprofundus sp.]|nr:hypothetical protein [Mariprofundus sp.]